MSKPINIEIVPRFIIDGQPFLSQDLPEEKVRELFLERLDRALDQINYEKNYSKDTLKK